jgi:hypothetical protein
MPLLEKAFAKVHGSYSKIAKGIPMEAFLNLTGFPTMSLGLRNENTF